MNDTHEIPESLIRLLATKPFSDLSAEESALALAYLSPEDYDALHVIYCAATCHAQNAQRKQQLRNDLLEDFGRLHHRGTGRFRNMFWAAAAACLISVVLFTAKQFIGTGTDETRVLSVTDTVYVERPVPAQVVHDTVVVRVVRAEANERQDVAENPPPVSGVAVMNDLDVMPVGEFNSEANSVKGNSILFDTLSLGFDFVTM